MNPDKTKIELDKQAQNSWKMNGNNSVNYSYNPNRYSVNNFSTNKSKTNSTYNNYESKLNATNSNLESAEEKKLGENGVSNNKQQNTQEPKFDILAEINKLQNAPLPDLSELENKKEDYETVKTTENSNEVDTSKTEVSADKESNVQEENVEESRGEGLHSKISEILSRFGNKHKEDDEEDNIDDTKNFIAQIYNNKNDNTADDMGETKKIDLSEVNEKMKELDNLKIEPDYQNFDEMYARTFGKVITKEEPKLEEEKKEYDISDKDLKTVENVSIFEKLPENHIPEYKYIGIAFSTYIIIEMNNELYIIDQHAAHERIMYEKIKANYYSDDHKDSQLMLLPDIINLSHKDMQIAKDNMEIFEKAGFILEEFGENTIKLSGVPTVCLDLDTKELFLETLDEINTVARTAKQEIEEKFIATVACKAAVKANMALTREEVDNLMMQLLLLPNPFTCPHGRPTAIRMTKMDIEKKFSRR